MARVAPKPVMIDTRMRVHHIPPDKLTDRLTAADSMLELSSMGIPDVSPHDWTLEMAGLVDRTTFLTFEEIRRFSKRNVESVFVCSGDPRRPTTPLRRVANVKWAGADLAELLDCAGVRPQATHLWSYGLDHGAFFGIPLDHYVKDMPLSRLKQGSVLVAYEMNDAPLAPKNGFPVRLVIPGFYGTNCVKWLCRLELRERRASNFMTTRLYNDADFDTDPTGETTRPLWAVAPESIIVAPASKSKILSGPTEIWGWAWSNCAVHSVQVSTDGGVRWLQAALEPPDGFSWQRFSHAWRPPRAGTYDLRCRATDVNGRIQPTEAARNAIHAVAIAVEG
jgi:sulfane dehydrogenase subunit SoxC